MQGSVKIIWQWMTVSMNDTPQDSSAHLLQGRITSAHYFINPLQFPRAIWVRFLYGELWSYPLHLPPFELGYQKIDYMPQQTCQIYSGDGKAVFEGHYFASTPVLRSIATQKNSRKQRETVQKCGMCVTILVCKPSPSLFLFFQSCLLSSLYQLPP